MSGPTEHQPLDKSQWPEGPWHVEPDIERFDHLGVPCLLLRQVRSGHWCGYVAVPPGHPWHGEEGFFYSRDDGPDVHGGITYGGACAGEVCHVPRSGEPDDVWWLGFDCHHSGDLAPMDLVYWRDRGWRPFGDTYRDIDYVRNQTRNLAVQARRAQGWTTV